MTCVLIVEDDAQTVEDIMAALHDHGFALDSTGTGREAMLNAAAESCDATLLDRMPPGGLNGVGTLATLQTAGIEALLLNLSARSHEDEQVSHPNPGEIQTSPEPTRHLPRQTVLIAAIPLLCTLLLPARAALAREARVPNEGPARISNIWGGFDHQPTKSQVQIAERARGVAPSAQEQSREAQIMRQLNRELLKSVGVGWTAAIVG